MEIFESISRNDSIMLNYGLGQLYIYKGEMEKSILHFERVIAKDPENYETIKVFALRFKLLEIGHCIFKVSRYTTQSIFIL